VTDSPAVPPAGWYPDPAAPVGRTGRRWWDGVRWTEHVVADPPPGPADLRFTPDGEPVAGVGARIGAYVIDSLVLGLASLLLGLPFLVTLIRVYVDQFGRAMDAARAGAPVPSVTAIYDDALGPLVGLLAVSLVATVVYHGVFLRWRGATPGKLAVGLQVKPWEGRKQLSSGAIARRLLAQYWVIPLQLVPHIGSFIGLWTLVDNLCALGHPQRRTLHDRFAGTVVIDARGAQAARAQQHPGQTGVV